MEADLLRAKGVNPTNGRPASVPGFALRIGQRATLLPNPNGLVHDILMQLTPMELEQLYSEPSVRAYRPEAVPCEVSTRLALVHVFLLYGAISLSRRSLMKPIRNTPRSCVILRYGWACPPRLCCWYSMKLGFDSSVFRGVGGLWLWTCSRLSGLRPESCRKDCLTRRKSIRLCVPSHIA